MQHLQTEVLSRLTPEAAAFLRKRGAARLQKAAGGSTLPAQVPHSSRLSSASQPAPALPHPLPDSMTHHAAASSQNEELWRLSQETGAANAGDAAEKAGHGLTLAQIAELPALVRCVSTTEPKIEIEYHIVNFDP